VAPWSNDVGYGCSVRYAVMEPAGPSLEIASEAEQVGVGVVGAVSGDGTGVGGHGQSARIAAGRADDVAVGLAVVERGDNVGIVDIAGHGPICSNKT